MNYIKGAAPGPKFGPEQQECLCALPGVSDMSEAVLGQSCTFGCRNAKYEVPLRTERRPVRRDLRGTLRETIGIRITLHRRLLHWADVGCASLALDLLKRLFAGRSLADRTDSRIPFYIQLMPYTAAQLSL